MTLVLSMNPFLDPEGDPPLSTYQPIWESERCTKTCLSNPAPPCSSEEQFTQVSRIAYFKRKFVDDDDEPPFSFRTYCQTVAPVLEERAHVLRLSLEKMRFIDDPEAFLRRSVLVNNLLRRLRAEILLQSTDWCFPPNPAFTTGPCVPAPSTNPAHQALHGAVPTRICLAPQAGPPFRKRFRMVRGGQGELRGPDCAQTCCCIYAAAAAAGHYLHLPFSMYDAALSTCPSTPHSSSFFQLASHSKLGLSVAVEEHDDEDEDVEEEEENEEEEDREEEEEEEEDDRREAGPSIKDKSSQKSRTRTLLGHAHTRTEEDSCMTDRVEEEEEGEQEEEEEEEEEEGQVVRPCQWDSAATERIHKVSFWHRRAHRQ
ncbi:SERTA domain-containing protein 4 isoform X2 [Centropristis striata]|uniref:SERTA domain-containing protein 4 isoform X2 n=1 Tax=Centropristis striata TaxID=184440 RepID=UPI0027E0F447|nr:SERTA domain-containing protein 4 isoform X2 [Centropristis striata]